MRNAVRLTDLVAPVAAPPVAPSPPPAAALKLRALRDIGFTRFVPARPELTPTVVMSGDDIFVLAFICKRVGRCPDSDAGLRW